MKLPRWVRRAYAKHFGYFWIQCPLCSAEFGGHEWKDYDGKSSILYTSLRGGIGICPTCTRSGKGEDFFGQRDELQTETGCRVRVRAAEAVSGRTIVSLRMDPPDSRYAEVMLTQSERLWLSERLLAAERLGDRNVS